MLTERQKRKYLDKLPFLLSHAVIKCFFDLFPSSMMRFNKAFGVKVVKLVFF